MRVGISWCAFTEGGGLPYHAGQNMLLFFGGTTHVGELLVWCDGPGGRNGAHAVYRSTITFGRACASERRSGGSSRCRYRAACSGSRCRAH